MDSVHLVADGLRPVNSDRQLEIDEVEDGASMLDNPDVAVVVAAGELLESSCRACNPIRGFGAGRRSYTSSLSRMLDPCRLACALWQKNSKPQSRANISF